MQMERSMIVLRDINRSIDYQVNALIDLQSRHSEKYDETIILVSCLFIIS